MNLSSLGALDRRVLITGALAAIVALISFVDTSGDWGAIMILGLLGGLAAVFVALQPQVAPTMKLPVTKGMAILGSGALAAGGFVIAMLNYVGYITRNITDIYVLLMLAGLIASLVLLWTGWQAYQSEPKAAAPPPAPPPAA
jgi:hypothetical protein